jgi:hypothetical protein
MKRRRPSSCFLRTIRPVTWPRNRNLCPRRLGEPKGAALICDEVFCEFFYGEGKFRGRSPSPSRIFALRSTVFQKCSPCRLESWLDRGDGKGIPRRARRRPPGDDG